MKVICVNYGITSPLSTAKDNVKEGKVYTVRCEETGFSEYAQRIVEAYGFEGMDGLYEKLLFIPLSGIDEGLTRLLNTKPLRKKKETVLI